VRQPGVQSDDTSFHQDQIRETKQTAFFASFDYDIIPKVLTVTAGTRHFKFDNSFKGTVGGSFGCFGAPADPTGCKNYLPYQNYAYSLDAQNLAGSESGWKSRVNITWHVTPDAMVYYTFSQGFRPGGFNQNGGSGHAPGPDGVSQFLIPRSYSSDKLANNELGWKTEFFNHRLQWNGAIYREDWKNVQISFFNPGLVGNLFYNTNGQDFVIKGLETSLVARVFTGLTLQAAAAWNRSEQTNSPSLPVNNPDSVNYGKPLTQICNPDCSNVTNPFGPIGAPSADSPPMQFSLRARYDWTVGGVYEPFFQVAAQHVGHSYTQAGANPEIATGGAVSTSRGRFENPAYTTYNASFGVAKDALVLSVFAENLTNSHASTFISTDQFIIAQTPLRPRVLGMSIQYSF
jgi:outer membrane receptor protein involved in Fe transport